MVQTFEESYTLDFNSVNIENIRLLLHNRYPFIDLMPRNRFQLYSKFVDWVKTGRKTTTIRFKRNGIDYPLRRNMPLSATETFKPAAKEWLVGSIVINQLTIKQFKHLDSDDARRDGFDSLLDLKAVLKEIYHDINEDDFVSIYTIVIGN